MSGSEDLPAIDTIVELENGREGVVYRHEYDLEGLDADEVHVMLLTADGGYDEVLTCCVEELEVVSDS